MIAIKMRMPKYCEDCPCSYWVQSGDYEGMLMCQAIEANLEMNGLNRTGECIVDQWPDRKPENCPMFDVILPEYCPHCGKPIFGGIR